MYAYQKYKYTIIHILFACHINIEKVVVSTRTHTKWFYYTHTHTHTKKAHMLPMARYSLIRIENEITHKVGNNTHAMQYAT